MTPLGDILITSQGGLWHVARHSLSPRLIEEIKTPGGPIKADNFNTIFIDNHGGVWIGTYHSGLLYSHPLRFRMHSSEERPEMLPATFSFGERHGTALRINDTITDSRGWLWSATSDGLKVTRNTGDSVILYTENGLVNNNVKSLVEAADGTMWAGTAYGISSVRPESDGGFTVRSFDIYDGALPTNIYRSGPGGSTTVFSYSRVRTGGPYSIPIRCRWSPTRSIPCSPGSQPTTAHRHSPRCHRHVAV